MEFYQARPLILYFISYTLNLRIEMISVWTDKQDRFIFIANATYKIYIYIEEESISNRYISLVAYKALIRRC
jgi:hypothetical protein